MPKILIDSRRRDNVPGRTSSPVDYTYTLDSEIKVYEQLRLMHISMPKSVYNVSPHNNTFKVHHFFGLQEVTIVLTPNQYTGSELAAELQTQLQASALPVSSGYLITYNVNTNKLSIDNSAVGDDTVFAPLGYATVDGYNSNASNSLLGLPHSFAVQFGAAGSVEFPYQVDLSGPRYLYLQLSMVTEESANVFSEAGRFHFALSLTEAGFGEIVNWDAMNEYQQAFKIQKSHIKKINVRWFYDDGHLLADGRLNKSAEPMASTLSLLENDFHNVDHHILLEVI